MRSQLRIVLAVLGLGLFSVSASAVPVLWVLNGVAFSDGGTASGSFVYDADTNTYSNINITTTPGSVVLLQPRSASSTALRVRFLSC